MQPDARVWGAGPAGLMAAEVLATAGLKVEIADHMPSPARKFLLAGRGGLNLTHSEPLDQFLTRYGEDKLFVEDAIRAFPPQAVIDWCHGLGVETFVGSSGRVFPKAMKASPLLRAWLKRLADLGVEFNPKSRWEMFADDIPTIIAFGGASWPHLGSDAGWVPAFRTAGIRVNALKPANGRFLVAWTKLFRDKFGGTPVKNAALTYAGEKVRGELVISQEGIEGGAIYALSRIMRDSPGEELILDMRPDLTVEALEARLARPRGKDSLSNYLRKIAGLTPVGISLLRETNTEHTAVNIKSVPITILRPAGIARAISTAGGVVREEVDLNFMLRKKPGTFICGEMLDWEAPTGGYLLQACFSTGVAAAHGLLHRIGKSAPPTP
jgi:uncharacterized flavoprotein (TIGR03862 family)